MDSIRLTTTLLGTPDDLYDAWISGKRHAAMTGSAATSEKKKGGKYTAWNGYISGKHLELDPGKRILQTWRTTEFPDDAPDSRLELRFAQAAHGTKLTLLQSGIPDGQGEMYAEGWQDHYFEPMSRYFVEVTSAGPGKKASTAKAPRSGAAPRGARTAKAGKTGKAGKTPSRKKTKAKKTSGRKSSSR